MPPGPVFNWLCVAHSAVDILANAARIRASQLSRDIPPVVANAAVRERTRKRRKLEEEDTGAPTERATPAVAVGDVYRTQFNLNYPQSQPASPVDFQLDSRSADEDFGAAAHVSAQSDPSTSESIPLNSSEASAPIASATVSTAAPSRNGLQADDAMDKSGVLRIENVPASIETPDISSEPVLLEPVPHRNLQSSRVPSSRIGRLFHYGGLAASLGYGAASELLRRSTSPSENHSTSLMMTEGNIKRLVSKLTQMRGAALKLGQFMSIQDSHVLPPEIENIFRRVQDSAHYMPDWQMEEVLRTSLGSSWADHFSSFDRLPFAAASIGQVHSAMLAPSSSPTGAPAPVAVKIQFPNIVNSIDSDLSYVNFLLTAGKLLPKGLFLDRTIQVMKEELADECDYSREASFLRKFGHRDYLGDDPRFKVPWVWEGSTDRVLVMERVEGVSVGGSTIDSLDQNDRDDIASRIIELCLKELFVFRVMQTDPNWTNFLWNPRTRQIELVDFGATREYTKDFIDSWLRLLQAAASDDRNACIDWSLKLGYLTGEENDVMLDAHVKSMTLLATPFRESTPQPFTFGHDSSWADITAEIKAQIPVMLNHRLTPPPRETYSLNRKLSGAFLLASRLNAQVDCKSLWDSVVSGYSFSTP